MSLCLLCVTLLIGPLNLLRKRLNPVNIELRRDTGIWAGITGCLHVVFALLDIIAAASSSFLLPTRTGDRCST